MGWISKGWRLAVALLLGIAAISGSHQDQVAAARNGAGTAVWPKGATINGLTCPTVTRCFAVGGDATTDNSGFDHGFIATTRDGGTSWTMQHHDPRNTFLRIACTSSNRCVAAGTSYGEGSANNTVMWTHDGGKTWHPPSASLPDDGLTSDVSGGIACPTARTCLIPTVLIYPPQGPQRTLIVLTKNGGRTWNQIETGVALFPSMGSSIACPTAQVCYLAGSIPGPPLGHGGIVMTRDGGAAWSLLPGTDMLADLGSPVAYESGSIACPDVNDCYTEDGWSPADCVTSCGGVNLFFGAIVGTQDAFTHSRVLYLQRKRVHLIGPIVCPGTAVCYVAGRSNTVANVEFILSTKDGGQTWAKHRVSASPALACPSIDTCYVAHGTTISRTTDGGVTWQTRS